MTRLASHYVAPGVLLNPNYWETARGQQELRQQARDTQAQVLADAQREVERSASVVQSGATVFSPEDRVANQQIAEAGQRVLRTATPLVSAGLIDPRQLSGLLVHEIGSTYDSQQKQRMIGREIQAAGEQFRAGRLTEQSLHDVIGRMHAKYGNAVLANPNYAELAGLSAQRQQAIDQRVMEAENQFGVKMTWDERTNRPVLDQQAAAIEVYKAELQDRQAERQFKADSIDVKNRGLEINRLTQRYNLFANALAEREAAGNANVEGLRSAMSKMEVQLDKLLKTAPSYTPPDTSGLVPKFTTPNDLEAAYAAGQFTSGRAYVGGTLVYVTNTGQVTRAE